jgi:hypothetical protein
MLMLDALSGFRIAIEHHHARPLLQEAGGGGGSNPASSPGDQDTLILQSTHELFLLSCEMLSRS